jgi:hypothetical protein
MLKIARDALLPGMKLAKPVMGQNGMVLLAEGTQLNEKLMQRIQEMDIEGIFVEGAALPPDPLDETLASLEKRFESVQDRPNMGLIKRAVQEHIESLYS